MSAARRVTAERVVPAGTAIARASGAIGLGAGIVLLATAIGAA